MNEAFSSRSSSHHSLGWQGSFLAENNLLRDSRRSPTSNKIAEAFVIARLR
jgi:hypothetical protein